MNYKNSNKIIHGLWIGENLSSLELLTLKSFVSNGHDFYLWVYNEIKTPVPFGVKILDANKIIPFASIFRYKYQDQYGHGKGSFAGFSDIFRYKLLYEYGGWWADMDVTCLKPFEFDELYVFRPHHDMPVVGNIIKCPKGSNLMKYCFERAENEVDECNNDWHKPIKILNDGIEKYKLSGFIKDFTNPESFYEIRKLIIKQIEIPDNWHAIHWINEEWRRNKINKNYCRRNSVLMQLFEKYDIPVVKLSLLAQFINYSRISFPFSAMKHPSLIHNFIWNRFIKKNWGYVDFYIKKSSK